MSASPDIDPDRRARFVWQDEFDEALELGRKLAHDLHAQEGGELLAIRRPSSLVLIAERDGARIQLKLGLEQARALAERLEQLVALPAPGAQSGAEAPGWEQLPPAPGARRKVA